MPCLLKVKLIFMDDKCGFAADLVQRYPALSDSMDAIVQLGELMLRTAKNGGTIFSCGNGGSAADADHIAGELMKGFLLPRPLAGPLRSLVASVGKLEVSADGPLASSAVGSEGEPKTSLTADGLGGRLVADLQSPIRALSLCSNLALLTAIMNDQGQELVFAQQVLGLCRPGDLLICLSTSGKSQNVLTAAALARVLGARVAALTGNGSGPLAAYCDVVVRAPGADAGQVQDLHRPIYHAVCSYVETSLFG